MYTLRLSQPLFVMLVKLALLDALIQFDVISLPQNGEHFVVDLPDPLVGVLYEFEYPHEYFPLVEDALQAHSVEDVAVDAMEHLADELWVVLLAQEEGEDRFEQF